MVRHLLHQFKKLTELRNGFSLRIVLATSFALFILFNPSTTFAGQYFLGPATGTYSVGSTFDVQVLLNTDEQSVNALDVDIRFPADRLQLVSPKTSVSVIEVWTSQPKFNNSQGTIRLQGGIPRGINVNNALVATLTFRVKSVGNAIIRFGDNSKILLNDGLGTNDLRRKGDGIYTLTLPPPAGPTVVSETHSVQGQWYSNSNLVLRWTVGEGVDGYSFILDQNPVSIPDDVLDGKMENVVYKDLADGQYYFHIKSFRNGAWGGITHFAINIDTESPAQFPIEILPATRSTVKDPVIKFTTTDTRSGVDHYELKIVSLNPIIEDGSENGVKIGDQDFFIEAQSPYVSSKLDIGAYDVIIRAIDKAGNIQESVKRFNITTGFFAWSSREGLIIGQWLLSWVWLLLILIILIAILIYVGSKIRRRHEEIARAHVSHDLPDSVRKQLLELKRYKSKYGAAVILLMFIASTILLLSGNKVFAEEEKGGVVELSPPYVTTVSKNVSNSEIFYVGGKTENKDTEVIIYTQNLTTGETSSFNVTSNKKGEWFYRHNSFLSPGSYVIWTQAKIGDIVSPPSPQIEMKVERAAITFGVTRIGYETIFGIVTVFLLLIVLFLIFYIIYHAYHQKKKHILLSKEISEAEESIRRGFAVLRRDIEQEINRLKKNQLSREATEEERRHEEALFKDLKDIEERIGKEVWDIEKLEAAR
jgi:uncharacterized membrane protein